MRIKQVLLTLFLFALFVYLTFGLFLFVAQKSIFYYPNNQDFENCPEFKEFEKSTFNGTRFYLKEKSNDLIIFYHGNAGSACDRSYLMDVFDKSNASVLFVEYTGYCDAEGKPSKSMILNDVRNINNYFGNKTYNKIYVYGESIGTGAASFHASIGRVDKLVLITPFSSTVELAHDSYPIFPMSILLTESYDNVKNLENYTGQVEILHGDSDVIIPNKYSKELYDSLITQNKTYILISNAGHNDLWYYDTYREELVKSLD